MTIKNVMLYKVFHTDKKAEIRYFKDYETMSRAAAEMIDSFKFWGGGAVPVSITSYKIRNNGKYAGEVTTKDYSKDLYISYARENGNKCGYLQMGG